MFNSEIKCIFVENKNKLTMRKITLTIALILGLATLGTAQIANNSNCKKTCEIERVVQKGTLLGVKIGNFNCGGVPGIYVLEVLKNTSAEKFGFVKGDIIYDIDGVGVENTDRMIEIVTSYKPSDLVNIGYKRAGKEYSKDVILGAKSTEIVKERVCCEENNDRFFNDVNISLFPNPTTSKITLSMDEAEAGKYGFQIFDITGKEVMSSVENFDNGFSKTINVENLESGEYFFNLNNGKNSITKAFVIAK